MEYICIFPGKWRQKTKIGVSFLEDTFVLLRPLSWQYPNTGGVHLSVSRNDPWGPARRGGWSQILVLVRVFVLVLVLIQLVLVMVFDGFCVFLILIVVLGRVISSWLGSFPWFFQSQVSEQATAWLVARLSHLSSDFQWFPIETGWILHSLAVKQAAPVDNDHISSLPPIHFDPRPAIDSSMDNMHNSAKELEKALGSELQDHFGWPLQWPAAKLIPWYPWWHQNETPGGFFVVWT